MAIQETPRARDAIMTLNPKEKPHSDPATTTLPAAFCVGLGAGGDGDGG